MRNVDIVILDLFLPQEISVNACADLSVPVLEKMLARAKPASLSSEIGSTGTLEEWLCRTFGIAQQMDEPIAPITLMADGMQPGTGVTQTDKEFVRTQSEGAQKELGASLP